MRELITSLSLNDIVIKNLQGQTVLNQINLEVAPNIVHAVGGDSGSGKSVFAKILAGLVEPDFGSYLVNNKSFFALPFDEQVPFRVNIGYSFDLGGLLSNRTIYDNLMLPLEYHNVGTLNEREKVVNDSLESFKLIQFKNDRPAGIPGSARKATCVARAFIYSPQVLILDEPTQGLRHELNDVIINKMRALTKMNKNQFIIIASSDETFLQALRLSGFSVKTHSLMMNKEIAA